MPDQNDVRRIALSLPDTTETTGQFGFAVRNGSKLKGFTWVWLERVAPKKARVADPAVIAVRVAVQAGENGQCLHDRPCAVC